MLLAVGLVEQVSTDGVKSAVVVQRGTATSDEWRGWMSEQLRLGARFWLLATAQGAPVTGTVIAPDASISGQEVSCLECGEMSVGRTGLTKHLRRHLRPEGCRYCPLSFANTTDRAKHEHAHTDAQLTTDANGGGSRTRYKCRCGSETTRRDNMLKHQRLKACGGWYMNCMCGETVGADDAKIHASSCRTAPLTAQLA